MVTESLALILIFQPHPPVLLQENDMEEKVPPKKIYVAECFVTGFRGHPHGLESRGELNVPQLALALLDLAGRTDPLGKAVTLRSTIRKFIDPNISGGNNYISKSEVAELVKELFLSERHIGALATLHEVGRLGFTYNELDQLRREYLRIDRIGSAELCVMFGCWPPQRR